MKRLGDCKVIRALGRRCGNVHSRPLTRDEIDDLADVLGEVDASCGHWYSKGAGLPNAWKYIDAVIDIGEADEPAFNANTAPRDSSGVALSAGDYEVRRGSEVRLATVFEGESCELLVRFADSDRTQRVDECDQMVTWTRITTSGVR